MEGLFIISLKYPGEELKEEFRKAVEPTTPLFWGYDGVVVESVISNNTTIEVVETKQ